MDTFSNSHFIKFDTTSKRLAWNPPEGVYNAVFKKSFRDITGRDVLTFELINPEHPVFLYCVRHGYRESDRWKLNNHLFSWLGEEKFGEIIKDGGLALESLYGKSADVEVEFLHKSNNPEPLRVIKVIAPYGSLLPLVREIGEFQI
jgi:hypothetical protein